MRAASRKPHHQLVGPRLAHFDEVVSRFVDERTPINVVVVQNVHDVGLNAPKRLDGEVEPVRRLNGKFRLEREIYR